MIRQFKFRGYDNPAIAGYEVYFGDGEFTVGSVYTTAAVAEYETQLPDAEFEDDTGESFTEEIVFFDEVVEETDGH